MKYKLTNSDEHSKVNYKTLLIILRHEKKSLSVAFFNIVINAVLNMMAPYLIGVAVNDYMQTKHYHGVIVVAFSLLVIYIIVALTGVIQTKVMGGVGQRVLFDIRNRLFTKLQDLPVDFFNQNKSGDLISRINNDTNKLNEFFSQSLIQFMNSIFFMGGAVVALLTLNLPLGACALAPAIVLLIFTRLTSRWVKYNNRKAMQTLGSLSAEIQENLNNFKVIVAFNRRDFFRKKFDDINSSNYRISVKVGLINGMYSPIYGICSNIGQLVLLSLGIYMILQGSFTVGFLISFITYVGYFYDPLRRMAVLWATFQTAMAAWDRIWEILSLESDLPVTKEDSCADSSLLSFHDVTFSYPDGSEVLHHINIQLKPGKTYAFVGPTGGGKTTTASLMARLYDPTEGNIYFQGKDIRSYTSAERADKIGFILQDPILFQGTVLENLMYGNEILQHLTPEDIEQHIAQLGLKKLLDRFDSGLQTEIRTNETISLGQKQLIAFMRAVLRRPQLLILDEATANIDTVSEQLLEEILNHLPHDTTKVIIAHRLNTIENSDDIFFVNSGGIVKAGSSAEAYDMLQNGARLS